MTALLSTTTGIRYPVDQPRWKCDAGGILDLEWTPVIDPARISRRPPTMWRYREAIPIGDDASILTFGEGFTPLLRQAIDGREVLLKQEYIFQTGSYKDRGASVLLSKVRELGVDSVVQDSSGNAGCAVAAYSARGMISCQVFVPEGTSPAKLAQLRYYGADVCQIRGSREETARAALLAAESAYYASHSWNPFFLQGTKTFAYEVCEQMGWKAPDSVVLPAGNGTLLLGAAIGFNELYGAGLIGALPRLIAVQSAACDPLVRGYNSPDGQVPSVHAQQTLAEGIAIAEPVRGSQMLKAVRKSGGRFLAVEEAEIIESLQLMARLGFYIEPTSAAVVAGLRSYLRDCPRDEQVVCPLTGSGLKSTEKLLSLLDGDGP